MHIVIQFILGILLWTFTEYWVHRILLHLQFTSKRMIDFQYYFHFVHHISPRMTFFLPFYYYLIVLFSSLLLLPSSMALGFYAGFLIYECLHYTLHVYNYKNKLFRYLRKHHFKHHYQDYKKNYAVTFPLWDMIFLSYLP